MRTTTCCMECDILAVLKKLAETLTGEPVPFTARRMSFALEDRIANDNRVAQ